MLLENAEKNKINGIETQVIIVPEVSGHCPVGKAEQGGEGSHDTEEKRDEGSGVKDKIEEVVVKVETMEEITLRSEEKVAVSQEN